MPEENYGMKIFSAEQIRRLDQHTQMVQQVGMSDLIERAAQAFVNRFVSLYPEKRKIFIFSGIGNNGCDGLAISRKLGSYQVLTYVCNPESAELSLEYKDQLLLAQETTKVRHLNLPEEIPVIETDAVVIDALLGTGINRPAGPLLQRFIDAINNSGAEIVSVDVASGLFASEQSPESAIVQPNVTLTFELPKLCFFLPQNQPFVGSMEVLLIGLDQHFIASEPTSYVYLQKSEMARMIKPRAKYAHKGTFGHVLLFAGGKGKMGAALLCAHAALRTGCGLLSLLTEESQLPIVQTSLWEAMCVPYTPGSLLPPVPDIAPFTMAIGPGIGKSDQAFFFLEHLLNSARTPLVLDADALNLLSENPALWPLVPQESILTPHPKEFERMAGSWSNDFERLALQQSFSQKIGVFIVLKGANTSVSTPGGESTLR